VDPEESDQIPSPEESEPADEAEAEEDDRESEADFEGDSIQTAQDKIMTELTRLKDEE
jgi:hypothetical protein